MFLKVSQISQENTRLEPFFNKAVGLLLKRDSGETQVFSCEICEFFKNKFFNRTPPVAASEQTQEITVVYLATGFFGHLA